MRRRGGARPGAGRPKGAVGIKKKAMQERLAKLAETDVSPLEVLLQTMRDQWAKGTDEARKEACAIARDAAPYIHHRLSSVDMTAETVTSHVVRLPAKSESAEEWLQEYMSPPQTPKLPPE